LHAEGDSSGRIVFTGDRLDDYYKDLPGSWPGIIFSESSENNLIRYTVFKNANDAIVVTGIGNNATKLSLNACTISNASGSGVLAEHSSINAVNSLIYNCGSNVQIMAGGTYHFTNCTVAAYSTDFISHNDPVLNISNTDSTGQAFPLDANFINSIFYGDDGVVTDEIAVQQNGNTFFSLNCENDLYKGNAPGGHFVNCLQNEDPLFVNTDPAKNAFDFHLQSGSPCVNAGKKVAVSTDLDGVARDSDPDIGCHELQ
jgi:hypothetical protein